MSDVTKPAERIKSAMPWPFRQTIPIPMKLAKRFPFPWDPWGFPIETHLHSLLVQVAFLNHLHEYAKMYVSGQGRAFVVSIIFYYL